MALPAHSIYNGSADGFRLGGRPQLGGKGMKANRIIGALLALALCAGLCAGAAAEGDELHRLWDIPFFATEDEVVAAVRERTGVALARASFQGDWERAILESPEGANISLFGRFDGVSLEFRLAPEGMAHAAPWTEMTDEPAAAILSGSKPYSRDFVLKNAIACLTSSICFGKMSPSAVSR